MLKSSILHFIIIGLFSSVLLGSSTTISELKSPDKNTVDFTFNSVNKTSQSFSTGTIVDKVSYELNALQKLFPRLFKVSGCQKDSYNTLYCPDALVKAGEYWGYDQSEVIAKKQTVIDFEQGTYQELTSTVRDFMDGFASTHNSTVTDYQTGSGTSNVGTVIDYQNGSSTVGTGSVMDFTSKVNTTTTTYSTTSPSASGDFINPAYGTRIVGNGNRLDMYEVRGYMSEGGVYYVHTASINLAGFSASGDVAVETGEIRIIGNGNTLDIYKVGGYLSEGGLYFSYRGSIYLNGATASGDFINPAYGTRIVGNGNRLDMYEVRGYMSEGGVYYVHTASIYLTGVTTSTTTNTLQCPSGYTDNGTNCQKLVSFNFYQYTCPASYSPINSGFTSYSKSDPNTSTENWNSLDDAINSATPPTGNCQKTITYSYYKYNCPTGYTVNDGGLTSACPRTDPNNTINNEATLSQACNNSTPPTGNCTKVIPYTFYSYECSSGYTAIDKGLATCSKTDSSTSSDTSATLDDPCNSVTPPKENCYKDISYKHYTYGCSPGYITDNYGLSTCPKTDPNKSINNSATLDDACNSATPPPGNCQKPIEFSYFQYICTGTNAFGETYSPINPGLNSCNKTDPNNITVNGTTLDDACNSSTPPVNNCQATEYTCNSNIIKPALVDGKWQCSPYVCNSEQKCGTATCNDYPPSNEFFMDQSLLPMKPDYNGSCVGVLCDITMNKNISYCDAGETCPKINGVYTKNGKCYYDDCPQGSFVDANGNCVVE